jgi:alpha-galactosidase
MSDPKHTTSEKKRVERMNRFLRTIALLLFLPFAAASADMLAPTPQMGFNNWYSTFCRSEFNEEMIRGVADKMVTLGLKDAGYNYVNLDDCWAESDRDENGNLVVNRKRFPHGLKALGDYIHSKGMKFGIYTSAGTYTCQKREDGGFPGALGHEQQDAALFASLGVDYVKYDNCNNEKVDAQKRYSAMGKALRMTGQSFFYSLCEWGENKPWLWAKNPDVGASSWRTTGDIEDKFDAMRKNYEENVVLDAFASPGHWNDPDLLEVGNGGMTTTEDRTQFSLWAIMASPLIISTDLRKVSSRALEILGNREVIAMDQDTLGKQGKRVRKQDGLEVIVKPLADGSRAIAIFNTNAVDKAFLLGAAEIGVETGRKYIVRDLWRHTESGSRGQINGTLASHATNLYRIRAVAETPRR